MITAQEEERKRIARELHDDAGQRVALLSIATDSIKSRIADDPRQAEHEIELLQQEIATLSNDLRDLSHELHPGPLEHLGLIKSVQIRCAEVAAQSAVKVRLEVGPDVAAVPPAAALCLYRVAQEALHNIVKHAHARSARISLTRRDGCLAMSAEDDGCGFDSATASRHNGLGLMSLDERVRMLEGTFAVTTARQAGTTVSVTIPVRDDTTVST